jgi:hypothetical protein
MGTYVLPYSSHSGSVGTWDASGTPDKGVSLVALDG